MSPDTRAAARGAADRLHGTIDRHLAACAARSGEGDPRVQAAYDAVREAAEAYDDALYDAYGEVTPFEFPSQPAEPVDPADVPEVARLALILRRDYAVRDLEELLATVRSLENDRDPSYLEASTADAAREFAGEPGALSRAVYALVQEAGIDGLDEMAEDAGLDPLGSTLWVVAADEDDDLFNDPFDLDEERLLYRVDEVVE